MRTPSQLVAALLCLSHVALAAPDSKRDANNPKVTASVDGYCVVTLLDKKSWKAGKPQHTAKYDGRVYQFVSESAKTTFLANPNKYVPALHGDCILTFARTGKRIPGKVENTLVADGRMFLFSSKEFKNEFSAKAGEFVNADLAFSGDCSVCLIDAKIRKPGTTTYVAHYKGLRYLFPKEVLLRKFQANPAKYEDTSVKAKAASSTTTDVSISGRSACAVCEFGVSPINDPNELGMAVFSPDGRIYVVEKAHTKYPQLYEKREKGLKLALTGRVVKTEGKVVWVEPKKITTIQ